MILSKEKDSNYVIVMEESACNPVSNNSKEMVDSLLQELEALLQRVVLEEVGLQKETALQSGENGNVSHTTETTETGKKQAEAES